ncbi:unnamed protein product [Didymodactylos carnosus]|uniref:Uncharacterized protein n=1 Tax=Didymodactylos carnosus TaxID=1234261 RepID=A0A814ZVS8_9BILA|nr:unnamed protein product [Didymodactylos carnosus]CAF4015739.1 unnamed protein product [Didymodactylos carnosus]
MGIMNFRFLKEMSVINNDDTVLSVLCDHRSATVYRVSIADIVKIRLESGTESITINTFESVRLCDVLQRHYLCFKNTEIEDITLFHNQTFTANVYLPVMNFLTLYTVGGNEDVLTFPICTLISVRITNENENSSIQIPVKGKSMAV